MLERGTDFVVEGITIYRLAATTSACWIPSLDHEVWNDAVEDDIVVVASLSKCCKVFACLMKDKLVEDICKRGNATTLGAWLL